MGRDKRAIDPAELYHAFCRGSNRGPIVFDDLDCDAFLRELEHVTVLFEWEVLASCLMPNHHHTILRSEQEAFSAGFQQLNGNHSRRTNRRHGRSDHLFRNRPRTKRIDSASYLIACVAYVLRNPIDAGLVEHAAEWPWSSYRALVGLDPAPAWLQVDAVLELFGRDERSARRALERYVHEGPVLVSDTHEEQELALTL